MAENLSEDAGGGKTGRKAKKTAKDKKAKANGKAPGPGHNSADMVTNLGKYLGEMDKLKDDQEKMNGEFAVDIGNVKEKFANLTGHTRKHLTKVYTKHRRELKEEKARLDMEAKDRAIYDELEEACRSLPLFGAAGAKASD